jgi:hypothetical protein
LWKLTAIYFVIAFLVGGSFLIFLEVQLMSLVRQAAAWLLFICAICNTNRAVGVGADFENPPYVSGANLEGQDGWVLNSYVGPGKFLELNGDVTVSADSPLAGSQSLLYNETAPLVGNGGGADASKANVITVVKNGTTAVDLRASVLMQVDANVIRNGQVGLFFSFNAFNGNSPIGVLLNNVNSATGSGRIEPLDQNGFNIVAAQPYVPNNVLEFRFGIDFDTLEYELSYRDLTAGGPLVPMVGLGVAVPGRFRFTGGSFPSDGDGQTFTVDVGTLLRGGTGRIDDLIFTAVPEPTSFGLGIVAFCGLLSVRRSRS